MIYQRRMKLCQSRFNFYNNHENIVRILIFEWDLRFSAVSQQAACMRIFCKAPAGGMHEDFLQSLQAECMRILCSVPVVGMHEDFLQFPAGRMHEDFLQCPCRRNA